MLLTLQLLEACWQDSPLPSRKVVLAISQETELPPAEVLTWFVERNASQLRHSFGSEQ